MRSDQVRVLYIAGDGRSGSTLLERTLGQLPFFVAIGETRHIWLRSFGENQLCGCGRPFSDCPFWKEVLQRAYGNSGPLPEEAWALQRTVDRIRYIPQMHLAPDSSPYARRKRQYTNLLISLYRAVLEVSGARVIVDSSKDISTLYLLSKLREIDLRVLHLIRDSRGVAYSWTRKKERPEVTDHAAFMRRYSPQKAAWNWIYRNLFIETVFARRHQKYCFVRYEAFVQHPEQSVRTIVAFAGEEDSSLPFLKDNSMNLESENHTVSGNPMRFHKGEIRLRQDIAWRHEMKAVDRLIVTAATIPLLLRYDYPVLTGRSKAYRVAPCTGLKGKEGRRF